MSIPIPAERVPPIAKEVADNKKTYAALWWFGTALAVVAGIGQSGNTHHGDGAYDAGYVAGMMFWVVVLGLLGFRQWRMARRAARAMQLATAGHTAFVLSNRLMVAVDERGVSLPDATFKITGKHVTMLTALPAATVIPRDSGLPRG